MDAKDGSLSTTAGSLFAVLFENYNCRNRGTSIFSAILTMGWLCIRRIALLKKSSFTSSGSS